MNSDRKTLICATMDCGRPASHEAEIFDGVSDEGVWAPYCDECADVLERGGDTVRRLDGVSSPDEEDIAKLEAEVERLERIAGERMTRALNAEDEIERLQGELARAVETRENANTVSVRVQVENERLQGVLSRLADLTDGLPFDEMDSDERVIERAIRYALAARRGGWRPESGAVDDKRYLAEDPVLDIPAAESGWSGAPNEEDADA